MAQGFGLDYDIRVFIDPEHVINKFSGSGYRHLAPQVSDASISENREQRIDQADTGISLAEVVTQQLLNALSMVEKLGSYLGHGGRILRNE
jgi:hypothetical protein